MNTFRWSEGLWKAQFVTCAVCVMCCEFGCKDTQHSSLCFLPVCAALSLSNTMTFIGNMLFSHWHTHRGKVAVLLGKQHLQGRFSQIPFPPGTRWGCSLHLSPILSLFKRKKQQAFSSDVSRVLPFLSCMQLLSISPLFHWLHFPLMYLLIAGGGGGGHYQRGSSPVFTNLSGKLNRIMKCNHN